MAKLHIASPEWQEGNHWFSSGRTVCGKDEDGYIPHGRTATFDVVSPTFAGRPKADFQQRLNSAVITDDLCRSCAWNFSDRKAIAAAYEYKRTTEEKYANARKAAESASSGASTVNWDDVPPDVQERVLTAVANDRPYLNAVQNSDAQNAGIELDAALQRAIRDTLVGLIRENPQASAALSETAAQLKTNRELRDRLAARVDGMVLAADGNAKLLAQPEEHASTGPSEPVPNLSASGLPDDVARQAYAIILKAHGLAREQDVLSSTARQRLPEDKRHTKPRYNKAERERQTFIDAEFERIAAEYDELAKRHGIKDEQRAIIADLSNPIGKHLDDEEARQVFRDNWGYAAAVHGEEEAFRVAQWAVDNWRERGGNEAIRKEAEERQRRNDERRAESQRKLAWIREKLAAGESVQFVTAMYGGAGATRMGGQTVTPALMAQWDAAGQDLLKIGPEGDLAMATGRSGKYVSESFSALVASDGQAYDTEAGMVHVRRYDADPEDFKAQYQAATPAVNKALKAIRAAKTRDQFGEAVDAAAANGLIRTDTDAERREQGLDIYGGRRVYLQLDPHNPGSIINAVWWGDNEPVEAIRLWAGRSGPHQFAEDVSSDGAFAGWHRPAFGRLRTPHRQQPQAGSEPRTPTRRRFGCGSAGR